MIPITHVIGKLPDSVPRMRGDDPESCESLGRLGGVFPACAGMIPDDVTAEVMDTGVPRMRGDDPEKRESDQTRLLCSPHARG